MRILTTEGYVDAADCRVGQAVIAIDPVTGDHLTNFVEEVDVVKRPRREPWQGLRFGKHKEKWAQDWERWTARRDDFAWVKINGEHLFFANQSVWANDNVTHAKRLKIGDELYDAADTPIIVREVDLDAEGPAEWIRFKISGDHSYVGDDVTLHNASRFWVLGTANWDASTTTNWSATSGGIGGASVPTSSDDVSFDTLSNTTAYTVTITATANCRDMTWALPAVSGVPTLAGTSTLNVAGNLLNVATMLWTHTGSLAFTGTGKTLTSAGVTINSGNISFLTGSCTLQDDFTTGNAILIVSNSTFNSNAKTISTSIFRGGGSQVRTITITNSTINVRAIDFAAGTTNLTFNSTGSVFNINKNDAGTHALDVGNLTYDTINAIGAGATILSGSATVKTFNITSTTAKSDTFAISGSLTIAASGALTIAGNSTVNRAFILSNALGTQRTITVPSTATVTLNNADLQDIVAAGTFGGWAYNAGSNSSLGDALGNSGITFNPSTTQTYAGGTNNWSTLAAWTSRVPLPQDDVVVNTTTAGTLTADMPRLGRNIDFTGFTRTISLTLAGVTYAMYGNWTFSSTTIVSQTRNVSLQGRGAQTFTSAGVSFGQTAFFAGPGGTYTLQDALTSAVGSGVSFQVLTGCSFNANNFNVTIVGFTSNTTGTITMGSGTWTLHISNGTAWSFVAGTLIAGTSTIKYNGISGASALTFGGGGKTYNNLWWSDTAATGTLTITGANTFNDLKINRTTARGVRFPAGVTNTIASWTDESLGTAVLTVDSSTNGVTATLSKPGGDVRTDYLSIQDSTATGGANWRAGPHSTNVSNNTGWIFGNVDYPVSASLGAATAQTGLARSNQKPTVQMVCAAVQSGFIVETARRSSSIGVSASVAATDRAGMGAASSLSLSGALDGTASATMRPPAATLAAGSQISGQDRGGVNLAGALQTVSGISAAEIAALIADAAQAAQAGINGAAVSSYENSGTLATATSIDGTDSTILRPAATLAMASKISASIGGDTVLSASLESAADLSATEMAALIAAASQATHAGIDGNLFLSYEKSASLAAAAAIDGAGRIEPSTMALTVTATSADVAIAVTAGEVEIIATSADLVVKGLGGANG